MIGSTSRVRILSCCLAIAVGSATSGLVGCGPEGVGTMKPPEGKRPPDTSLGRPFGNAPVLPKKPATKKAPDAEEINKKMVNPRL